MKILIYHVFQIIINSTGGFETVVKASPRSERCPSRARLFKDLILVKKYMLMEVEVFFHCMEEER